jgi:hypothetical protein
LSVVLASRWQKTPYLLVHKNPCDMLLQLCPAALLLVLASLLPGTVD